VVEKNLTWYLYARVLRKSTGSVTDMKCFFRGRTAKSVAGGHYPCDSGCPKNMISHFTPVRDHVLHVLSGFCSALYGRRVLHDDPVTVARESFKPSNGGYDCSFTTGQAIVCRVRGQCIRRNGNELRHGYFLLREMVKRGTGHLPKNGCKVAVVLRAFYGKEIAGQPNAKGFRGSAPC
jgi:hypothetical protein